MSTGGRPGPSRAAPASNFTTERLRHSVYISHAGTERDTIAVPLQNMLQRARIHSFLRAANVGSVTVADPEMETAMSIAPIGVFILSPEFVAREHPMKELECFVQRVKDAKKTGRVPPILIPVFYRLGVACWKDEKLFYRRDDMNRNIFVRDGFFARARGKFLGYDDVQAGIRAALRELRRCRGVVNKNAANNSGTEETNVLRADIISRTAALVEQNVMTLDLDWGEAQNEVKRDVHEVADPLIVRAALKEGSDKLDTVRLMVLGGSTRGKTSTLASLRREAFDSERESTRGVDLSVYFLVLGRMYGDQDDKLNLIKRDKFQSKFIAYATKLSPIESATEDTDVLEPPFSESGWMPHELGGQFRHDDEESSEGEDVPEAVLHLAEDALLTSTFDEADVEGTTLRCWDFGGQREYEIAHELFISPRSILMLVFDLCRFEDEDTRAEETRELSHWLQTLFAVTPEEDVRSTAGSLLIVGTRRDSCRFPEKVSEYCKLLKESLADVLDAGVTASLDVLNVTVLAIENSTAVKEPNTSGLQALEKHLDRVAKRIIVESRVVPLRWLAFVESLHEGNDDERRIFLNASEIKSRMNGFHFPLSDVDRREELRALLLYFRDLGEIVLFDRSRLELTAASDDYIVFLEPEKVLRALKVIVAPERIRCEGLVGREDRERMRQGILTTQMLSIKWQELEGLTRKQDRDMLVELLTSMDLFIKLGNDEVGVPALLPSGWDDWGWIQAGGDKKEVAAVTTFENYVPFGLIGRVISRLHRTIGAEQTNVQFVRSNAVLVTIGLDDADTPVSQLFMGFDTSRREVHWKVRGENYGFRVLGHCLSVFEAHMSERMNTKVCNFEHFFVTDCPRGCNEMKFRLMFRMPSINLTVKDPDGSEERQWWDTDFLDVEDVSKLCRYALCRNANCHSFYSYMQSMGTSEPSVKPGVIRKGVPVQYAVFVSHAGPDKDWAVRIAEILEQKRLRTFVDRLELVCSSETGDELMDNAMRTARAGVFILSPEFFGRRWTMRELRTFLSRNSTSNPSDRVVIYPIFHRLSYNEAANTALDKNPKFRAIFEREGFFDADRQRECSTRMARAAMKKLSRYPGLEKKLQEMHSFSMRRSPIRYRFRQMHRLIRSAVNTVLPHEDHDDELGGVSLDEFFEFAAERVASEYYKTHEIEAG